MVLNSGTAEECRHCHRALLESKGSNVGGRLTMARRKHLKRKQNAADNDRLGKTVIKAARRI